MKKVNKLNIFLDIDDVIFNFHEAYSKHFKLPIPKGWDNSPEMINRLKSLKKNKNFWLTLPLKNIPNFQPSGFVSARGIPKSWTKESLKLNNIKGRSNVHQVMWNVSKLTILKELGCDLFIDDKIETFEELNKAGTPCLLMTANHNKDYKTPLRINSLDINKINKLYARAINFV
jgi:hypothetical protein